jgi:hypothetical protein
MNYYKPGVADWFDDRAAGRAAAANIVAFNTFLELLDAGVGVPVPDVESSLTALVCCLRPMNGLPLLSPIS